ncbi:hypothetical protein L1987_35635 [Smallanthus sonchifolius]|uniref:Uncharacterized protein n=1 Tax=Smallanthus sonchifolius TaxID=185202 RepID=A0ACB9HCH8_9ASTR|nr:hypothetical protein L1987_35635 [Smallanthus sonchifolius]
MDQVMTIVLVVTALLTYARMSTSSEDRLLVNINVVSSAAALEALQGASTSVTLVLYFRGQRIWQAIIEDLLPKGLGLANKALLSGCSAGGLASYLHCNNFSSYLPDTTAVKCLGDAGFFLDSYAINFSFEVARWAGRTRHQHVTYPENFLSKSCHSTVPPSADPDGHWNRCKLNPKACGPDQIRLLHVEILTAVRSFLYNSSRGGVFINSCFAHCQSESQDTWFALDSPQLLNETIAESVGDWYFSRNVSKKVDCPYPCDTTCHNLIGAV